MHATADVLQEGVLAICQHILRSVNAFEYVLPQLTAAAAAAATLGSDAGHLLPEQISDAVYICTQVLREHPDQLQALQVLHQDLLRHGDLTLVLQASLSCNS